jgi:hypothetical protein
MRGEMTDRPACLGPQRGNSRVHHRCESFMLDGFRTLIGPRPGASATLAHGSRHDPIPGSSQARSKLQHGTLLCPVDRAEPVWGCDPDPRVGPHWTARPAEGRALRKPVVCSGSPRNLAPEKAPPRLSTAKRVGEEPFPGRSVHQSAPKSEPFSHPCLIDLCERVLNLLRSLRRPAFSRQGFILLQRLHDSVDSRFQRLCRLEAVLVVCHVE